MFRNLAQRFAGAGAPRDGVFLVHPAQLSRFLEDAWAGASRVPVIGTAVAPAPQLGSPTVIADYDLAAAFRGAESRPGINPGAPGDFQPGADAAAARIPMLWDHLVYAYLLESTGVVEIMAEVLRRLAVGETLEPVTPAAAQWARATEELFFRDPPLFSITGVVSQLRPDARVGRRNAYWRMFGMDLPHPIPPAWLPPGPSREAPWKADTGAGVNTVFREKWSELLRQLWLGMENSRNFSGPNATDAQYVGLLCQSLDDMLGNRRRNGALAREEFSYVSMLSWFHLTLETDSPIVVDLQAIATSAEERLARIGQRVGIAPAARSRELFELADRMSALLWAIEFGLFNDGSTARTLYDPAAGNPTLVTEMNTIIDLWQSATGDRVKDRPAAAVAAPSTAAQPLRIPSPTAPSALPGSNGRNA